MRKFSTSWSWISCWADFVSLTRTRRMFSFPRIHHGWDLTPKLQLQPNYLAQKQNLPSGTCLNCSLLFCGCGGSLVLENFWDRDLARSQKNGHSFYNLSYELARRGQSFHSLIIPGRSVWTARQRNFPPIHYVEFLESSNWLECALTFLALAKRWVANTLMSGAAAEVIALDP